MEDNGERTFLEYLRQFSEEVSPLDFMLVWDHIDRFLWGAVLTLEITFLALLLCMPCCLSRWTCPGLLRDLLCARWCSA